MIATVVTLIFEVTYSDSTLIFIIYLISDILNSQRGRGEIRKGRIESNRLIEPINQPIWR
jgi:hypothetical protein